MLATGTITTWMSFLAKAVSERRIRRTKGAREKKDWRFMGISGERYSIQRRAPAENSHRPPGSRPFKVGHRFSGIGGSTNADQPKREPGLSVKIRETS